jgi:hypothetical protein
MENVFIKREELNKWIAKYFKEDLVSIDDILRVLEDLEFELDSLKEEFEDYKQMVTDNYKPISAYSMYGVSKND